MIEAEAKKTICPKMSGYVSAGVEGSVDFYECLCFGSACQWWVWDRTGDYVNGEYDPNYNVEGHCGGVK